MKYIVANEYGIISHSICRYSDVSHHISRIFTKVLLKIFISLDKLEMFLKCQEVNIECITYVNTTLTLTESNPVELKDIKVVEAISEVDELCQLNA